MSNYKHFKHYYDPYDSLDVEWQNVVSKGHLTISEVVSLSDYTKSYVYRLVKDGIIPCMNGKSGKQVRWIDFVHWYSHLPETPVSPIGEASFGPIKQSSPMVTGASSSTVKLKLAKNRLPTLICLP